MTLKKGAYNFVLAQCNVQNTSFSWIWVYEAFVNNPSEEGSHGRAVGLKKYNLLIENNNKDSQNLVTPMLELILSFFEHYVHYCVDYTENIQGLLEKQVQVFF